MVCFEIVQYLSLLLKLLWISTVMDHKIFCKKLFSTKLAVANNSNPHQRLIGWCDRHCKK